MTAKYKVGDLLIEDSRLPIRHEDQCAWLVVEGPTIIDYPKGGGTKKCRGTKKCLCYKMLFAGDDGPATWWEAEFVDLDQLYAENINVKTFKVLYGSKGI